MNSKEYLEYHKQFCDKMHEIAIAKNHDYSSFSESAFANFEIVESCGIAPTEVGFLTRMMDKISRVNSFVKTGVCLVTDEKITDSLADLSNYCVLLSAYIISKKQKP